MKEVIKYISNDGTLHDTPEEAIQHDKIDKSEYLVLWCSALKSECVNQDTYNCNNCDIAKEYRKYGTVERN